MYKHRFKGLLKNKVIVLGAIVILSMLMVGCTSQNQKEEVTHDDLAAKLFKYGGHRYVIEDNVLLETIYNDGRIINYPIEATNAPRDVCHHDSYTFYNAVHGSEYWTGYALINNQWIFHSWCVYNGSIIEFNNQMDKYYGLEITGDTLYTHLWSLNIEREYIYK